MTLEAVKRNTKFFRMRPEFQMAVNDRLNVVGSKTREEMGREERIALMKEALENVIPKDLLNLIGEY